jgi:hypothetical protein
MEKKNRVTSDNAIGKEHAGKKTPVIIELTDEDLGSVVGAARCPPSTFIKSPIDEPV